MSHRLSALLLFATLLHLSAVLNAQQDHSSHDHEAMMHRGEQGMGFSQTKTNHHFLLKPDGGVIAVSANDAKEIETRDHIRMHLTHIAQAFAAGDFDIPGFVHDQQPPGVPAMKRLANKIEYRFHETERGGEVALSSTSAEAVQAIHDFLTFQIREHQTGDPIRQ